jgi:rubrerythrin
MKRWESTDDILEFAIGEEEAAARFYEQLAAEAKSPEIRQLLLDIAREEIGHKTKLLKVQRGLSRLFPNEKVSDLKISDYLVEVEPDYGLDYQQALIVAMKKENAAFKLYTDLAGAAQDEELRQIFLALAQEEAKHKLRFELEYDNSILTGN